MLKRFVLGGLRLDRRIGFLSIEAFGFMLLLVWGSCGNCWHRQQGTLRIELSRNRFDTGVHIEIVRNYVTTTVDVSRKRFTWNSEHIARRWGEHYDPSEGSRYVPEHWTYRGWLGYHLCV